MDFDSNKIINAIQKAMVGTELGVDTELAVIIATHIEDEIDHLNIIPTVESIQDMVEECLMETERKEVARKYILYRRERDQERNKMWEMNTLQKDIWESKYRYNNESFNEFIKRVSGNNSKIEKLIRNKDFLFGGRILAGRGIDRNVSLANCTTLPPVQDNIESIFQTAGELARMFSYGQGAGIDISLLRPKGAKVNNASKTSTGAVSFMSIFDAVGDVIGAEGRRSALLIAIDADHDDIFDFINVKNDVNKINNANISVKVDDKFMKQDTLKKQKVLRALAESSWKTGEPAILAWDNNKRWHLLSEDEDYEIEGVNACSEYPTTGYGTCLLGSINLSNYVLNPFTNEAKINVDKLEQDVWEIVIGMNEVLDESIPTHPLKQQREVAENYRQIGIGIMALADMLIKLGVKYGSEDSLNVVETVMRIIQTTSILSSVELAKKHGSFPKFNYDKMKNSPYFKSLPSHIREHIKVFGIRNSSLLSIAPAGTISLLCGASNGLEPLFANSYIRTTKSLGAIDREYKVYADVIEDLMEFKGITSEEDLPDYCVTAHDINPYDRIKLQSKIQYYVDLAISSTINLKEDTTIEEIENIYKIAYKKGLKGVSVFRDNCFRVGILNKIGEVKVDKTICPECEGELIFAEGCSTCYNCGFSACSI